MVLFLSIKNHAFNLENVAMFGIGVASGTVFHELGHAASIWVQGGQVVEFNFQSVYGEFKTNDPNVLQKQQRVSLSGYLAQSLATEFILSQSQWHNNDFAIGWMSLGIFVNLSNPIRYYVFGQKDNDLGIYESFGGDPFIPALMMAAHAALTFYRLFNDTDIPVYFGTNIVGVNLNL